jgi:U11/U12 small nuclear ribonucleoprotein SNRNP65
MNKMNIPAPFRPALPTPPLPPPAPLPAPPKRQEGDLSSGESELESSNEEDDDMEAMNEEIKNSEEAEPQLKRAKKRAKREAIVGPAVDKTTSHEAAGVKPIHITPKANLIRKNKPVLQVCHTLCSYFFQCNFLHLYLGWLPLCSLVPLSLWLVSSCLCA